MSEYYNMKPFNLITILFLFITFSCNKDAGIGSNCSVKDPVKDLGWLASDVEQLANSSLSDCEYIYQANYRSKTVFVFTNCCPSLVSAIAVYNCSGELLGYLGSGRDAIDPERLKHKELIWKADSCTCNFKANQDLN